MFGPSISMGDVQYVSDSVSGATTHLYSNGDYEHKAKVNIPNINYSHFSVSADFLLDPNKTPNQAYTPIVVGGQGWRWFSIFVNENNYLGISLNNQETIINSNTQISLNSWYNVTATVNIVGNNKQIGLFLGNTKIIDHFLPNNFVLDVINDSPNDNGFMLTNYSNGKTFHGLMDNLKIYNGTASPTPNPNLSIKPTPTPTPTPVS